MKHCLGVGNPNLNLAIPASTSICALLSGILGGFRGYRSKSKKTSFTPGRFFFLPQEKLPPKVSLWHVGQVNDKNVPWFSREFATEGGTKKFNETTMSAGGFRWFQRFVGSFVDPPKKCVQA